MYESIFFFSLKILSGSSLHFVSIRVFIVGYARNVKRHFSAKQGVLAIHSLLGWVTSLSREITAKPDCPFLSCSAPAIVTLQLSACFTRVAFWRVASHESLTRSSCENLFECLQTWILHTLSHTILTWFSPKYKISNCWNTSKFGTK